ncbi:MAG: hypothetical protein MPJ50_15805 [Pirellulales bacterium]|nr:hypothetical protein [Pirellulales bacterium]
MPAISVITPTRSLDAGSFSRLAMFIREFAQHLQADLPPVLRSPAPRRLTTVRPTHHGDALPVECEVLIASARIGRTSISQSENAVCQFRQMRVQDWTLERALQQSIAESCGQVIACCHPPQLPQPDRFAEMFGRLSRADFVAGRRRTTKAAKFLLATSQIPRRAIVGVQRRDPDFLCWVALREAVADLRWRPAAHRFLAELVTARGYRVAEFRVTDERTFIPPVVSPQHVVRNLLAAWKLSRKTEQSKADLRRAISHPLPVPQTEQSQTMRRAA